MNARNFVVLINVEMSVAGAIEDTEKSYLRA
jgi:hypothetical protein